MKNVPLALTSAGFAFAVAASAQITVFDNTGGLAPAGSGMLIYGTDASDFAKGGAMFVAPFDFTLDRVELGIWAYYRVTSATASVYTDAGDIPGTFLGSATISGISSTVEYHSFDFSNDYSFTTGTKVWITLVNATGTLVWNDNAASVGGIQQQSFDPDPNTWNPGEYNDPQLSLKVIAIPEPSTYGLLFGAVGLASALVYRTHCKRRLL